MRNFVPTDIKNENVLYNMTIEGNYSGTKPLVLAYFYVQFCMEYGLTTMNEMNNEKTRNQAVGVCSLVYNIYCTIWLPIEGNYSGTKQLVLVLWSRELEESLLSSSTTLRSSHLSDFLLPSFWDLFNKSQALCKSYQKGILAACSSVHHGCCGHR